MTEIHMADMTTIKEKIRETIYPNGTGAITAEKHQALLINLVNDINKQKADVQALTELEEKVDSLPVGGDVKADGVYPDLIAGDLVGRGESVPAEFTFRASGGKSIKDGRAYIKRIKGNSVVWNNMVDSRGYDGGFFVDVPPPIIQGHKYLLKRTHATNGFFLIPVINGEEKYEMSIQNGVYAAIFESPHTGDITRVYSESYSGACVVSDLTKMFGEGKEPSTIEEYEARKPIVADEYAFNEGEVIHMNAEGIKSVGDNAFNGVWYQGAVIENSGQPIVGSLDNIYTDTFRVIGGETYCSQFDGADLYLKGYFFDKSGAFIGSSDFDAWQGTMKWVAPINADSVRMRIYNAVGNITPAQAPNVMIRLDHSGWKSNTGVGYEPYWQDTLPLPIISKYFPQGMKKAGSAHDEIRYNKASGKWEYSKRKIKSVGLGSLDWQKEWYNEKDKWRIYAPLQDKPFGLSNILNERYATAGVGDGVMSDKSITGNDNLGYIYIKDTSFSAEGVDALIASLQGVMLYYESNDWEWVELDEADQNFRDYYNVADFGTEQMLADAPSAPFSADIIYQFNAVDMIREHELEITELQRIVAELQSRLS